MSGRILSEVTGEPMGDHSIPKGQPQKRPGSAWWRCEQMGHEGVNNITLFISTETASHCYEFISNNRRPRKRRCRLTLFVDIITRIRFTPKGLRRLLLINVLHVAILGVELVSK